MNKKIVKELFIIILLFAVIIFSLVILFYDCISSNKEKIESISYITEDIVNETISEIENNEKNEEDDENASSLLKSYSINANDLSTYESENYYESGKNDPFSKNSDF